jgi:hypothetical protein
LFFLYRYSVAVYVFRRFVRAIFGKMHRQNPPCGITHKKAGGQAGKISFARLDFWRFLDYHMLE